MTSFHLTATEMLEIQTRIQRIFKTLFEIPAERLTRETNLYLDLSLDSLDAIDLVVCFEREFKMQPTNDEMKAIRTMGDVYDLVYRYESQKEKLVNPLDSAVL